MHLCSGVYDHGLITCSEHMEFLSNYIPSRPGECRKPRRSARIGDPTGDDTSLKTAAKAVTLSEFGLLLTGTERPGGVASDDDEGAGVIAACAEAASGHDFAQCGGFVIFPHFLHRSLSLFAFLPLPPLPLDLSGPLCENLHLFVSSSASACGIMLEGNRRAVRTFVVAFGTLSRPSRAVAESSVRVHHCPSSSFALDGRIELSRIIRRKQICDFVHVVAVYDAARDRLQGLHHCLLGWRTSCRLPLLEVCEPLCSPSTTASFLSLQGIGSGEPLVKCCRVLCRAGQ